VDFSQLPTTPAMSFKDDMMPIFGLGCAVSSSCHDKSGHKANLILGDGSTGGKFDASAKWNWVFPTPLDPALIAQVAGNLVMPSTTIPTLKRVDPGKPDESFLLDKVSAQENTKGLTGCTPQDPNATQGPCGDDMPFNSPGGLCANPTDANKVQAIAMWIQQGASGTN
jgi:hypothetical protein